MSNYWDDYGDDWQLPAEYRSTLDQVVQQSIREQGQFLDGLFFTTAFLWLVNGGIRDRDRERWAEAVRPVVDAAHVSAAERGAAYTRLIHSLTTGSNLDLSVDDLDLDNNEDFVAMRRRSDRFIDSPIVQARWLLSDTEDPPEADPPTGQLKRAVDEARRVAAVTQVSAPAEAFTDDDEVDVGDDGEVRRDRSVVARAGRRAVERNRRYEAAMQRAASRAAEQAVGDATRAYSIGAEEGARRLGTEVQRWLKIPNPQACNWCFLVAGRGYRSAQSVARHSPVDKCGARPVWVEQRGRRKGEAVVRNIDWQQALVDAGYGGLIDAADLDEAGRRNVLRDIILRPEDFIDAIDLGVI